MLKSQWRTVSLDSFPIPYEPLTHKDHGSVQVLAVLLDEDLVILVRFPLVLIIKLRAGNHSFTWMDGKYGAEAQSNVSPILKQINFIDATRTQGGYSHLSLLFILKSCIILVHGEEWRGRRRREVAHNQYAIGFPGINGAWVGRCSKNNGRLGKMCCPWAEQGGRGNVISGDTCSAR